MLAGGLCCRMGRASECVSEREDQSPLRPSIMLHGGGSDTRNTRVAMPEHPIPYPGGPIKGVSFIQPALGTDSLWPLSLACGL
eukprot:1404782-Rhodomonas_salina.2